MPAVIRAVSPDDLPALRDLEREAGTLLRDLGMAAVAADEPPTIAELDRFHEDGRAWVATDQADSPVAYLLVEVVDDDAHVVQVSVHPRYARQLLGAALLDTAAVWAQRRGLTALTLTTYTEVPWNAPYYTRLGFQPLADDQLGSGLRRIHAQEAARGLARWPRMTMRRPLVLSQ